jgi:haloalkane dehalogenase
MFSRLLRGRGAKLLITHYGLFEKTIMRILSKNKKRFTKAVHEHYIRQFSNSKERKGVWVFPKEVIDSTQWLDSLWSQKENIRDIPALLVWGTKDLAFREKELNKWECLFTNFKTVRLPRVGHYVQEEAGPDLVPIILEFLKK